MAVAKPLWQATITTSAEAEEAVTELLESVLNTRASSYRDLRTGQSRVQAFLQQPPADTAGIRKTLRSGLERIRACGIEAAPSTIRLTTMKPQDWAESWKNHFPPIEIGRKLLVAPTWSKRPARPGQEVVVLDPGLSFGTGQHPTTRFCLGQLVAERRARVRQSLLDAGTGSGVLAIAAVKLGYTPVFGIDFDPDSIRVARANADLNQVARKLHLLQADVRMLPMQPARRYSVVCANLIATLLLQEKERLVAQVAPGGLLVLAGVLESEFAHLCHTYQILGLKKIAEHKKSEWQSLALRLP